MEARSRKVHDLGWTIMRLDLERMNTVQPSPCRIRTIGILIRKRRAISASVPLFAVHSAGMAADTYVEIYDQTELALRTFGQRRHSDISVQAVMRRSGKCDGGIRTIVTGF
jgi:hypothetical protein